MCVCVGDSLNETWPGTPRVAWKARRTFGVCVRFVRHVYRGCGPRSVGLSIGVFGVSTRVDVLAHRVRSTGLLGTRFLRATILSE